MKRLWSFAIFGIAAIALLAAGPAEAAKKGGTPEEQFKKLDKNGDNKVSREEFESGGDKKKNKKAGKLFDKLDKNGDGSLSLDEFKAISELKKKKKST